MAKFKVGMYYEEIGYIEIEADTEKEAKEKILEEIGDNGLDNVKIKCTGRNYDVTDVQKING